MKFVLGTEAAVVVERELEDEWMAVDAAIGGGESHVEDECPLSGLQAGSAINLEIIF